MIHLQEIEFRRRSFLAVAAAVLLLSVGPVQAADVSGDLVLLDWASGSEQDMIKALEDGFMKAYPNVHFKEINLTVQGDARGAIRAALQSGEKADLFVNTWPAFRKELADAGMLRDLGSALGQRQARRQPVGFVEGARHRPTASSTASPTRSVTAARCSTDRTP